MNTTPNIPGGTLADLRASAATRRYYHAIYAAVFDAYHGAPAHFHIKNASAMLTNLMGGRSWSWRVVGVTPEALDTYSRYDFAKPPKGSIVRGHIVSRRETARTLFDRAEPLGVDQFIDQFLEADRTVLMLPVQNVPSGDHVPSFIKFENPDAELFPSGLIAHRHVRCEQDFLRQLAKRQRG